MKIRDYFGDALGVVSLNILYNLAGMMVYFYTDVVGVAIGTVGTVMLFSKIFDAFTDIGMGVIVDRTKSKHGMARPWLLRMAIPSLLIIPLMFTVPYSTGTNTQLFYITITNFVLLGIVYTAIGVPHTTLASLETKEPYERSKMGIWRTTIAYLASAVVNILLIPAVGYLGGGRSAWIIMGIIFGVVSMATLIISFFSVRERNVVTPAQREKIPLIHGIKFLFKNKYWVMLMVANVFINLTFALANGASVYYAKYILGNPDLVAALGFGDLGFAFLGFFMVGFIVKKMGNRNTVLLGMVISITGCLLRALDPYNVVLTVITKGLTTIGGATFLVVSIAMVADAVEYGEWKTGKRMAGLNSSAVSFGAKIGSAFWAGGIGWLLAASGYDGMLTAQPHAAEQMIIFLNIYFPLICYAAIFIIMRFYKLDNEYGQIVNDLESKRKIA